MRTREVRKALWILRQLGVVLLGVVVYFGVRGLTAGDPSVAVHHAHEVLALEKDLGLNHEEGLQDLLVNHAWLTDVANWVYIWGHWPVIAVVMLWLGLGHRRVFLRLRDAMIASGAVGLVIYATYPVAPPRLAGIGLVDTVTERSRAYRILQPPAFVNQYAAMPSLHVGWDLLVGLAVASAAAHVWLRWVGWMMPVLMALAVVFTANHYLIDGVAGAVLALGGLGAASWYDRRRDGSVGRPDVNRGPPEAPVAEPALPAAVPCSDGDLRRVV